MKNLISTIIPISQISNFYFYIEIEIEKISITPINIALLTNKPKKIIIKAEILFKSWNK
jgi:hypothetical protein